MKLTKTQFILVSFMLFSLFFGAGNLIFPPFLGQNVTTNMPLAMLGFCITAVVLPVLGVIAVAKFNGLQTLANKVNPIFSLIFTILIYVSIGPGLGIPRAASVPFEMAIAPYLPSSTPIKTYMLIFSLVFFSIAFWLSYTPSKLVERIGKFLTPTLLTLIIFLFISFIINGTSSYSNPTSLYIDQPLVQGFLDGYQTMDAIAALNFGLVISLTISELGITDKKAMLSYTKKSGLVAGTILAGIYIMLSYMGAHVSGLFELQDNGAITLRQIVYMLFGNNGAILMAAIFTLACLTTCVGLITSISKYFAQLFKNIDYHKWVCIITLFSCIVCNQGLNAILSISVPVLDAIYPIAIVLIILGLLDNYIKDNKYIYPSVVYATTIISFVYALDKLKLLPEVFSFFHYLPLYSIGLGWVPVAIIVAIITIIINNVK